MSLRESCRLSVVCCPMSLMWALRAIQAHCNRPPRGTSEAPLREPPTTDKISSKPPGWLASWLDHWLAELGLGVPGSPLAS